MAPRPPEIYGIPIKELSRLCGVTERTARRWKDGTRCPPESALRILRRDLGLFSEKWRGWTVNDGDLVSPEGWTISRNDALAVPLMHGQISALRSELATLEAEQFEEQPLPDEVQTQIG